MIDREQQRETSEQADGCQEQEKRTENLPPEVGGREGPEPTRFGDWEKNGRCIDF